MYDLEGSIAGYKEEEKVKINRPNANQESKANPR